MGNTVTSLVEKDDPVWNAIRQSTKPTLLPGISTVRFPILMAAGSFFRHIVHDVKVLLAIASIDLPKPGIANDGATWLAIQNSILSLTTEGLVKEASKSIIKSLSDPAGPQQKEVPGGREAIWGYGSAFPSDQVVGDLFAKTTLARLLTYNAQTRTYTLDMTVGADPEAQKGTDQPLWVRQLLQALNKDTYAGSLTTFKMVSDGGERHLMPVESQITENGNSKKFAPANSANWQHAMTAAVTNAMFIYENFHACLHVMSATCATGLLSSVPFWNDAHDLIDPLVANVYFTQAEVFALLWGGNGLMVGQPSEIGYAADPPATYVACSNTMAEIARVSGLVAGKGAKTNQEAVDEIMKAFVLPGGDPIPASDEAVFAPGTRAEIEALVEFASNVDETFKANPSYEGTVRRLEESYAAQSPGSEGGRLTGLGSLGATVAGVGLAGGVFHSQTMLTKVFFTPLVSVPTTVGPRRAALTEEDLKVVEIVFGTIAEFNKEYTFGLFDNVGKGNMFYPAAEKFRLRVAKLHSELSEENKKNPPASGVQPTFYYPADEAIKMGFHNTSTTYV